MLVLRALLLSLSMALLPTLAADGKERRPPDTLPHSTVANGGRDIAQVWLAEPTARYAHAALGDGLEAAALAVRTRDGRVLRARLHEDAVFEDLVPRLADLDGDGRDEIVVVRSDRHAGAALTVWGVRAGALVELAATPPMGAPNRWLNPIGAADLDGDGRLEIAVVETPHMGGTLRVWSYTGSRLLARGALPGFSNHAIGSTELGLHAIGDWSGDGLPDLVVPDRSRTALRIMTMKGGALVEIQRLPLDEPVRASLSLSDRGVVTIDGRRRRLLARRQ